MEQRFYLSPSRRWQDGDCPCQAVCESAWSSSQAAFSRSIQAIEDEVGLRLFDRGPRGAKLTVAGEMVMQRVRRLLADARHLTHDIGLIRNGNLGSLRLGAGPVAGQVLLPALIDLRVTKPDVTVRYAVDNAGRLLERLYAEEIDLFFADPRSFPDSPDLSMALVCVQPLSIFARHDHPLAHQPTASVADFLACGLAMAAVPEALVRDAMRQMGISVDMTQVNIIHCDDVTTLMHIAAQSDTLAVLPQPLASNPYLGMLRALSFPFIPALAARIHAIHLVGRTLPPTAAEFVARVAAFVRRT